MFDLTVPPHEVFLFPDGFISFEPTVGPKRSVTVKAKYFYGKLLLKPVLTCELAGA